MAIDPQAIPESFLRCIAKDDRKPLGKAGVTAAEAEAKHSFRREKELQDRCVALLRLRNILPNVSRMDRRKTDRVGWPDITCSVPVEGQRYGIPCAFECKLPGCHPTPEQAKVMQHLMDNGWFVRVITSEEQFLEALRTLAVNRGSPDFTPGISTGQTAQKSE